MTDSLRSIPQAPRAPRGVPVLGVATIVVAVGMAVSVGGLLGALLGAALAAATAVYLRRDAVLRAREYEEQVVRRFTAVMDEIEVFRRSEVRWRADFRSEQAAHAAADDRRRRAEGANRAKTTFLSNLSRELRTPLNNVLGLSGILLDTALSDSQKDYARTIHGASEALIALVDDVLDLCRAEEGDLELDRREFELGYCLESVVETCTPRARERELDIALELDPGLPAWLVGDRARLRQVLLVLLGRAVERAVGPRIVLSVTGVESVDDQHTVRFEFGCPYPADGSQPELGDLAGSAASVGLSLASELIKRMGGKLVGDTSGHTFVFDVELETGRSSTTVVAEESAGLAGGRMLFISADARSADTGRATAQHLGMAFVHAETGTSALKSLKSSSTAADPYSVIVIDAELPDISGKELRGIVDGIAEVRSAGCVLLCPADSAERPEQMARLGFDAWIRRPISETRLRTAVLHVTADPMTTRRAARKKTPKASAPARVNASVLLAEDNLVNRKVMTLMLERMGCRVIVACNGMEAIEQVMARDFDIVLMDCLMPELDGYDATRAIRHLSDPVKSLLPIIALTAAASEEDRRACLDAGMNAHLSKPARATELEQVIKHWAGAAGKEHQNKPMQESTSPIDPEVLASLKELSGDDPGILNELIDLFLSDTPPRLEELSAAQASGNADGIVASAHALKSSCGNLGALALSALCGDIEARGRSGAVDEVASLISEVRSEFARVEEALRRERV